MGEGTADIALPEADTEGPSCASGAVLDLAREEVIAESSRELRHRSHEDLVRLEGGDGCGMDANGGNKGDSE